MVALISLFFLLLFSELASANFKRLAPVLEAWDQSQKNLLMDKLIWRGGWEKLATLVWALGASIPLLAFASACQAFLPDKSLTGNLVLGSAIGSNIVNLSLGFALILLSGPITFFRLRTISSPVFLLLATVIFAYVCLNQVITLGEGLLLFVLLLGYGFYFRRFSSEWKYYERKTDNKIIIESVEGILPIIAILCMGVGFFFLAVITAYPFIQELGLISLEKDPFRIGVHLVSFALAIPGLIRAPLVAKDNDTTKAIALTSLSHSCLLNVLLIPTFLSFFTMNEFSPTLLSIHLPVLLILTGVFVSTLLIEKEKGGLLTWILIAAYLLYTGVGFMT